MDPLTLPKHPARARLDRGAGQSREDKLHAACRNLEATSWEHRALLFLLAMEAERVAAGGAPPPDYVAAGIEALQRKVDDAFEAELTALFESYSLVFNRKR
jgi:hypothetical protein